MTAMEKLSWAELERMTEDTEDRDAREAHGFKYEDDWQDESLLCRNGCGLSYPDVASGKIRECQGMQTCGECSDGLIEINACNCGSPADSSVNYAHEPLCGAEPCPNGCWWRLHPEAPGKPQP